MRLLAVALLVAALGAPRVPSFTDEQATKGQILYYENCAECHGASMEGKFGPALAGPEGNVQWETVTYVWGYMTAHMPAGNADGLRPTEYVAIMAYLLKMHGHAPGTRPLAAPAAAASRAMMGP